MDHYQVCSNNATVAKTYMTGAHSTGEQFSATMTLLFMLRGCKSNFLIYEVFMSLKIGFKLANSAYPYEISPNNIWLVDWNP